MSNVFGPPIYQSRIVAYDTNRVDKHNVKARKRHLELVVARALRRREEWMAEPSGFRIE
jgi:hypothetical protein